LFSPNTKTLAISLVAPIIRALKNLSRFP